jgi:Beta-galactosidase trimerisation domain
VPYISIVATWEALQLWRNKQKSWNWPLMSQALGLVMLNQRISVDVLASTEMSEAWLEGQKVIALCGASGVSDRDARMITAWVEAGGGLLATYDTGLYDERGRVRTDGGALRNLLGVEMHGAPLPSQPECYYRVTQLHFALDNAQPGTFVEGDGRLVPVAAVGDAKVLADCWNLGTNQVRGPAVIANTFGKGGTIYISGSLEANYLYDRVPSTARWLHSMVQYIGMGAPQPFQLQAPRGVYGVLRRSPNGDLALWVLANVGFKDAASGRMRQEYLPLTGIEVAIQIPKGKQAKSMRLLRAYQEAANFRVEDGYAVATIPRLHIAEVVHLVLSD